MPTKTKINKRGRIKTKSKLGQKKVIFDAKKGTIGYSQIDASPRSKEADVIEKNKETSRINRKGETVRKHKSTIRQKGSIKRDQTVKGKILNTGAKAKGVKRTVKSPGYKSKENFVKATRKVKDKRKK